MTLSHDELLSVLRYEPGTGLFYWRSSKGSIRVGRTAGTILADGYVRIGYRRTYYMAHRLAWFYVNQIWPTEEIDHINGDRRDNRISNIRQCTRLQNEYNKPKTSSNTSGMKGVKKAPTPGKWYAQIRVLGKLKHLGSFSSATDAQMAYLKASEEHFGEFSVHISRDSTCSKSRRTS